VIATKLDPGAYTGTYKLIGGRTCLDFVNTVSWPGTPREHDWLDRGENLISWGVAVGLIDETDRRALEHAVEALPALQEVHRIRVELALVVTPLAHHGRPAAESIAALNDRLHNAAVRRSVDVRTYRWVWTPPGTLVELVAPVIWDAADVLTNLDHSRLGYCASCAWLFLDTTRNRSRRWCDMQDCGSRTKALRYYHRTKAKATPSDSP
jgi:predicted RNA-binding Zn ribbon-like protein